MLRRDARLRREYLFRKNLEKKERTIYEKKRIVKRALEEGKVIPAELKQEFMRLEKEINMEDPSSEVPYNKMDDEYNNAGKLEPKVCVTTSHNPSSRLLQFAKEMRYVIPNAQKVNRGHYSVHQIVESCRTNEVSDIIICHEHRGEPVGLVICHLPYGPTAYFGLSNCVLRHDLQSRETISLAYPHLVFHDFTTSLGLRVKNILKFLFPVPKEEGRRVISFTNLNDFISFRHHIYQKSDHKTIELKEVGPRFEMRLFKIILGTIEDQNVAEIEWALRSFYRKPKAQLADEKDDEEEP